MGRLHHDPYDEIQNSQETPRMYLRASGHAETALAGILRNSTRTKPQKSPPSQRERLESTRLPARDPPKTPQFRHHAGPLKPQDSTLRRNQNQRQITGCTSFQNSRTSEAGRPNPPQANAGGRERRRIRSLPAASDLDLSQPPGGDKEARQEEQEEEEEGAGLRHCSHWRRRRVIKQRRREPPKRL